jgi:cytochrome c553
MKNLILNRGVFLLLLIGINGMATPLYQKCIACHGKSGEKKALGTSLIIKDMTKVDFIAAMNGYKNGSYGKAKKALMKPQVGNLTQKQIEEIATFITNK